MIASRMLINRLKNKYTSDEIAVLLIIFSIFISVYAVGACVVMQVVYLIATGRMKDIFFSVKNSKILMLLPVVAITTSAIYGSYVEIAVAIGVTFVLIAAVYIRYVMTKKLFDNIIELACFLSILIFIIALLEKIIFGFDNPKFRSESVFYNPNYYATMIEIIAIFAIYKLMDAKRKYSIGYYILVLLVNLMGLILAQCRTAFAVIVLLVPVLFILLNKKKHLLIYAGFMAVFAVLTFVIPEILPRVNSVDADIGKRMLIWKAAIGSIGSKPLFGGGCLTYAHIYLKYGGIKANHAHNILLEMLLNYGIVGSTFSIIYFFSNIKEIFKMYIRGIDKNRSSLAIVIVFAVIVHGMLDATVFWPQTGMLVISIIACSGIYEREQPILNNTCNETYVENLNNTLKPKL